MIDPVALSARPLSRADGVEISGYWVDAGARARDGTLAFGGAGYQTIWFRAVGILAVLGMILALSGSRTAYLRARQRELEQVVATQTAQLRESERQLPC